MPLTPAVSPAELRAAVRQVRRLGNAAALAWLERREPELTELLLVQATYLHGVLHQHRLPPKVIRRLTRRIEHLGITLVLAIRSSQPPTPALPIPPDPAV